MSEANPQSDRDDTGRDDAAPAGATSTEADATSTLATERDELLSQLARARADYQNLRKRTQLDIDNAVRRSLENLLQNLFVVVDNLDFALMVDAKSEDAKQVAHGVELTRMQLIHALGQEGAAPIPEAEQFDPKLHEAVSMVASDAHSAGAIVNVLRRGWTWRGAVLRPTHVQVAAAPDGGASKSGDGREER